jgi:hypothetical protein
MAAAGIVLVCIGLVVLIVWLSVARSPWSGYLTGGLMVASGTGLTLLRRGTEEDFRRSYGEANASRMQRATRGGWLFIVLGAATIAITYLFD